MIFAGGEFTHAAGTPAKGIARWDGAAWTGLAGGLDGPNYPPVRALCAFDDGRGASLYAGGDFHLAGGLPVNHLARWKNSAWSPVDEGIDGSFAAAVHAMAVVGEGGERLWMGGRFASAGSTSAGHLASWSADCAVPFVYCAGKIGSQGCLPQIGFAGTPASNSTHPFVILGDQILSQSTGLLLYSLAGAASIPFQGGLLCVMPPLVRSGVLSTGGSSTPDCSGTLAFDFNAWMASGVHPDLTPGATVHAQFWYWDPAAPQGSGLSDALAFQIGG